MARIHHPPDAINDKNLLWATVNQISHKNCLS